MLTQEADGDRDQALTIDAPPEAGADPEGPAATTRTQLDCPICGELFADRPMPRGPSPAPVCPYCGVDLTEVGRTCDSCRRDLGPLRRSLEMADRYFNLALAAAHRKDWRTAAEHLAVTRALSPEDIGAIVLLGKVRFHDRQKAAAIGLWEEAVGLDPHCEEAKAALEASTSSPSRPPAAAIKRQGAKSRKRKR